MGISNSKRKKRRSLQTNSSCSLRSEPSHNSDSKSSRDLSRSSRDSSRRSLDSSRSSSSTSSSRFSNKESSRSVVQGNSENPPAYYELFPDSSCNTAVQNNSKSYKIGKHQRRSNSSVQQNSTCYSKSRSSNSSSISTSTSSSSSNSSGSSSTSNTSSSSSSSSSSCDSVLSSLSTDN